MELSQKNYKKVLPKELIKQAGKCNVRECDETEKGHFQAYIDEKESSFDVSIIINNKGEVTEHSCDCKGRIGFCRHKVALLLFIEKGGKSGEQKIKSNKKASPFEMLLEEVDAERLKDWVKSFLVKNKELELAFMHQFSEQQKQYKPADVKQLTLNAVKAVAKNRKKLEVSEVKKIVELWAEIHGSIIAQYYAHVTDEGSFLNFDALAAACNEVQFSIHTSGNRLNKYIADLLLKAIEPIHDLQDESAWDIATGYFAERINDIHFELRGYYLSFLTLLLDAGSDERKERLTHKLVKQYVKSKPGQLYNGDTYTFSIFHMVKNSGLFGKYVDLFKPVRFKNEYNDDLISMLIESGNLKLAEKYCLEQIDGNYRQEYSVSYLGHLKEIYTIDKANKKLSEVLALLIPQTFDFKDFLSVYEQMEGDEKKKWRTKILSRAGHMASYNKDAMLFSFRLMDYEQNYKKMIEYIGSKTPYSIIVQYADKMALVNRDGFIRQLMNKSDNTWLSSQVDEELQDTFFLQILNIVRKHYSLSELKLIIRQFEKPRSHYHRNNFVDFVKEHLS